LADTPNARFRYYGISPFEIEIIYDVLKETFGLEEEQLEHVDEKIASVIEIYFPIAYDESFFTWFSPERWFKIKEVLKEMTKRRGKRDIKIVFDFCGNMADKPRVRFDLKSKNGREFELAIEKIEYMVDTINIQLKTYSNSIDVVEYSYNEEIHKWVPNITRTDHWNLK